MEEFKLPKGTPPTGKYVNIERAENQENFLANLSSHASITRACREAAVDRVGLYKYMQKDEEFYRKVQEAREVGMEAMEDEARKRAMEGESVPIWKNGEIVGHRTEKSDLLMIFLLKGAFPEKYKDRVENQNFNRDMDLAERLRQSRERYSNGGSPTLILEKKLFPDPGEEAIR